MAKYRLIIDGFHTGAIQYTLPQLAAAVTRAYQQGSEWDVRRVTRGQGYRLLNDEESAEVITAITKELT
jgi:hypothetical protein